MNILPAILPLRYSDISVGVEKVIGPVDTVQIDFVDGYFAPNRTWWFNNKDKDVLTALLGQEEGLPQWETMNYEFDLMINDPLEYIDTFVSLGPSRILFHLESLDQEKMIRYFEAVPTIVRDIMTFGIAINIDTDPKSIEPYVSYIDTVQCMGIERIGFQGQPFDKRAIKQVTEVRRLYPDMHVSVDGGVSLETAPALAAAGADTLIVGSAIFESDDVRGTLEALKRV